MLAVAGGLARHVLCFRTLWEATFNEQMKQGKIVPSGGRRADWLLPFGATSAAHTLAQNAQRHFHRYGTTKETLGWIALNQRANAELNPTAVYRSPMTMDDYLNARPITTPFGLYDCDVPCDGAIAVIVSAVDAARDTAKPPVFVDAVGTQIIERIDWDQSTLTHEPQVLGQAAHLWSRTSLKPQDVDVAELYDGFTMNCLSWIEALGFCGIGEAKDFLDGGKNIARDGQLPLNTHGGQLSHGRTHGMGLLHEAITQLRGEAGERQVADARVGVVSSGGLTPSGVLLLRAEDMIQPRLVIVDGVPMSALVAEAPDPRAVIVAIHGGGTTALYFDCPGHPESSLLRAGAAHGYTVIAIDRPGYGSSAAYPEAVADPAQRVALAYGTVDRILGDRPRGAGLFLMAHSGGCELALRMAADDASATTCSESNWPAPAGITTPRRARS